MFSVKPANFEEFECRAQTRIGQVLEIAILWDHRLNPHVLVTWSSVFDRFLGEPPSSPQLDSKGIQGAPSEGPSCSVGGRPRGPHPSDTAGPIGPR